MKPIIAIFHFVRWPITFGVIAALALLAFFPERFSAQPPPTSIVTQPTPSAANPPPDQQATWSGPVSYAAAVTAASRGVVNIYTRTEVEQRSHPFIDDPIFRHFFNSADIPRKKRMQAALGSGVLVTEEGHILTNYHVIAGVDEIVVALEDGRNAHAQVLGENRERDLAVLKISLDNLHPLKISTQKPRVGDVVLAIGNPFGVGQSVSQGIISATQDRHRNLNISTFEDFIQTDAAIHPGSSGGALTDAHGNLVGINTANLAQSGSGGIGFAVPAHIAMQTLNDIVQFGRVVRGWLGVEARPVQQLLALESSTENGVASGMIITDVVVDGPADIAGLEIGDVIIGIDGSPVKDARDIMQRIQESRPGDSISIDIARAGRITAVHVVLQEQPLT